MPNPKTIYRLRPVDAVLLASLWYSHCRRNIDANARRMDDKDSERAFGEMFSWETALCAAVDRLPVSELCDDIVSNAPDQDAN